MIHVIASIHLKEGQLNAFLDIFKALAYREKTKILGEKMSVKIMKEA